MNKNSDLALINMQKALDNLPAAKLKRLYIQNTSSPVKKIGVQVTSSGAFVGYESGQYVSQVLELELYKE